IRGTQNVYPGLYEPLIAALPGVADAALAGVPDAIGDERIVVALVPADAPPSAPTAQHPLVGAVARRLPGLVDAGVLPDAIVAVPRRRGAGRRRRLGRVARGVGGGRRAGGEGTEEERAGGWPGRGRRASSGERSRPGAPAPTTT